MAQRYANIFEKRIPVYVLYRENGLSMAEWGISSEKMKFDFSILFAFN